MPFYTVDIMLLFLIIITVIKVCIIIIIINIVAYQGVRPCGLLAR